MRKSLTFAFLLMGFNSVVVEILLLRDFLVTFSGNELSIGLILGSWLLLEAAGSYVLGRAARKTKRGWQAFALFQLLISVFLPLCICATRMVKDILRLPPGEAVGLLPMFYSSFLILAPLSLCDGAQFTLGCQISSQLTREGSPSVARVYIYEALGATIGGLVLNYLFLPHLQSLETAFILAILNLVSGILLVLAFVDSSFLARRGFRRNGVGKSAALLAFSLVLLGLISYLLLSSRAESIHTSSLGRRWRGFELRHYEESIYGSVAVIQAGEQYTLFANGVPIITMPIPDVGFSEELVHLPLLAHPSPRKVLLVGGGVGGPLSEILKHPIERVDYTELDPLIIQVAERYATPLTRMELADPRVAIKYIDGRLFIARSQERYDVVIVNLPAPSTLQLNRYYTEEFFAAVRRSLSEDGILALTLPGSLSYLGGELGELNACIYHALRVSFPYVRPVPGDFTLFLASPSPSLSTQGADELIQRLHERHLQTRLLTDFHIRYKLEERKLNWFLASLPPQGAIKRNKDLSPGGVFYDLALWNALFTPALRAPLRLMGKANLWTFAIALLVLVAGFLAVSRLRPRLQKSSIAIAIVTTGFAGMAFDIILILAFQSLYGYVYHRVALLITAFMVGLSIGSLLITRIMGRLREALLLFLGLEVLNLAYALLVPVVLILLHFYMGQAGVLASTQAILLALSLLSGVLVGAEFPLANRIYLGNATGVGGVAGMLYAADLLGAWVGALLVSAWLIPVLGIPETCFLIAILKAASLLLVLVLALPSRSRIRSIRTWR